jgi:hypothetical protein
MHFPVKERNKTTPENESDPTAARNVAGTATRPLASTLFTKEDKNKDISINRQLPIHPPTAIQKRLSVTK